MSVSRSSSEPAAIRATVDSDPPRTARQILDRGRVFLEHKGVEEFRLDAELLVAEALGLDRLGLFLQLERPADEGEIDRARKLLVRRGSGEPVAYLTGRREFYGRPFRVGPGCLIPRPESEHIVDAARSWALERTGRTVEQRDLALEESRRRAELFCDANQGEEASRVEVELGNAQAPEFAPAVLDLGTGSGCLAITLALELKTARVVAVDREQAALKWARENAAELGAELEFHAADAFEFLSDRSAPSLDLVVCNPPYIAPSEAPGLAREVRDFEPPEALFAPGSDPDYWVRELLRSVPPLLRPGGLLLVELGIGQGPRVRELARSGGFSDRKVELIEDLAGIERVFALRIED